MRLAIVGFPDLDADDRHWIETFRAAHDPHAGRMSVHFTFVFPLDAAFEELDAEAAAVADISAPVAFEVTRTDVVPDAFGNGVHVFLVPDEGGDRIAALHDRLYAGPLKPHCRLDIPYIPHLTVAAAPDLESARRIAAALDGYARTLRGTLGALDLIDVSASRVRSLATYPLRREEG